MNPAQKKYLLALYAFIDFGPIRLKLLINYFKQPKVIWNASRVDLLKTGLSEKIVNRFFAFKNSFSFDRYLTDLKRKEVKYITYTDSDYPKNLSQIDNQPLIIYVRGKLSKKDDNAVAVVGARKMTKYGEKVASYFASSLAKAGVTIVSGLAFGIDAIAHNACVEAGGKTLAVLASGVDVISPLANTWLAEKILKNGGAIISEYPLGTLPTKISFPFRNRIISGISKTVIVVEGLQKSGTIHTAWHAAEQGKSVFAVPGQITSKMSAAPHFLIENGAKIAFSADDVLRDLKEENINIF